jgi:hypothetical protein
MQVVAKHASLEGRLYLTDVLGGQFVGLVELDLAAVDLAENAVEDDEVIVRVDVESRVEAMKEADGSELGVRRRSRAGAPERRANRAQQDPEHRAGDAHVMVEVRTQALRHGEHALTSRRQHVVGQMGSDLAHAPGVARRADASALAREGDQPLVAAILATGPGEPMGQNAALRVGPEVTLDPLRQSVSGGVGLGRLSQERLEVMLHDLVQSRLSRAPRRVSRAREALPSGRGGRTRTSPETEQEREAQVRAEAPRRFS